MSPFPGRKLTLTCKVVLITVIVGFSAWGLLDVFHTSSLKRIFRAHLVERFEAEALEDRIQFDKFVKAHHESVRLITTQVTFVDYIDKGFKQGISEVKFFQHPPQWLPKASVLRSMVKFRYAILLDKDRIAREVYMRAQKSPPLMLLKPTLILAKMSHNQAFLTYIEDVPFIVASESVYDAEGETIATVVLATPLDPDSLGDSRSAARGHPIALITGDKPHILASSDPGHLPSGTSLEAAEREYLIAGKSFFDYGASDLLVGYASFVSLKEIETLTSDLISRDRKIHAFAAFVYIALLTLIISRIAKRIEAITGRVAEFSQKALKGAPFVMAGGDQIERLEERFNLLTEEVVSSSSALKKAHDELEKRVEERTAELTESNIRLKLENEERRRAEEALRESEQSFRSLFNQASDAILLLDPSETPPVILDANQATCDMHGYGRDELIGRPITILDDPEGKKLAPERAKRIMAGEHLTFEVGHIRKDGSAFPVEASVRLIRISDKSYIQAIDRDISERKRAEEEKKSLISTLDTLVEQMPEGVLLIDSSDRISFANPVGLDHIKALTGLGAGDAIDSISGRPLKEFIVSPPRIIWHDIEMDGRVFELAGRSIEDKVFIMVIREVTEERAAKRRIELQDKLAAVGQMAAGIAHDFNNILTVIAGYAEMLLDAELPEDVKNQVSMIHQSGKKASGLVTQILDFSRKTVGDLKNTDLIPLIKEFTEFIRRAIPENIHIIVDFVPGRYISRVDSAKMQQVLANLAVNARDAMPEGGELIIGLSPLKVDKKHRLPFPDMAEGDWAALSIKDSGLGISPDVLPHIFEPFYSTKGIGKGSGLGLSQVYGIIKQHSGYIDVRSTPGKGSVFTIYLPTVSSPPEKIEETHEAELPKGLGETILVAEDEKAVLYYLEKVLTGIGYKLYTAENGKEALDMFKKHKKEIGLVLTDLIMPEMGGMELCREIKAIKPSMKVIALSGYPSPFVKIEDLEKAGFGDFIRKPFKASAMAQSISKMLKKE